ncbi:hypothetical protein D3C80_1743890 [compost metagenome]
MLVVMIIGAILMADAYLVLIFSPCIIHLRINDITLFISINIKIPLLRLFLMEV